MLSVNCEEHWFPQQRGTGTLGTLGPNGTRGGRCPAPPVITETDTAEMTVCLVLRNKREQREIRPPPPPDW